MKHTYEELHKIEEELIQIQGLFKALQLLLPDGEAHDCVMNALEERLEQLQKHFYEYWERLAHLSELSKLSSTLFEKEFYNR
ncbi:hypothetical protein NBRC110019_32120 [Neptunitalea chrysea]|uniref:Uncharacterized protein n=1 Tax=Neptunitalea chrysea TaxID=1647581 RepID=A0A9W6EWD6_9FLAO|nr:hypothetical protein [Neptunitalea chrysea]GLB54171.1 hypothetical protein NBRC110019_32120 [Neptunitalea chrysea]